MWARKKSDKNINSVGIEAFKLLDNEMLIIIFANFDKKNLDAWSIVDKRFARIVREVRKLKLESYQKENAYEKICSALIVSANTYLQHNFGLFTFLKHGPEGKNRASAVREIEQQLRGNNSYQIVILSITKKILSLTNNEGGSIAFAGKFLLPCLNQFKATEEGLLSICDMISTITNALDTQLEQAIINKMKDGAGLSGKLMDKSALEETAKHHIMMMNTVLNESLSVTYYLKRILSYIKDFSPSNLLDINSVFMQEVKNDFQQIENVRISRENRPAWPVLM
ncbi:MAG TPA: hypothetical protein VFF04_03120 [Candidatus Babeliales bacterium]|nr:hypothetical protein [Candidatus Babeliales bacterium]